MKLFLTNTICLLVAIFSFAQTGSNDTVKYIDLDPIAITVAAGPARYNATATKHWDILHTRIALSFDPVRKTAAAKEWITLKPHFYDTDSLLLDAKGMEIDSVILVNTAGSTSLNYSYLNDELMIRFKAQFKANDTTVLYLKYTAMPYSNNTGSLGAITDDKGLYFINTDNKVPNKPAQIWTQGETESNSHWMITIDKPNTRFTTEIELTVPDSMTTLSNGALSRQVKGKNGMRTDYWKMDKPIQVYGVMFAIGKYSVIEDNWKGKKVSYYVESEFAPYARNMFKNTTGMMDFFSQKTGVPYPWNKYSQVVARDYVSGAMENTTASLFGEFMNQNDRELLDKNYEDVVAHELFHQWFGDYVTAESWSNLTLNESFANYGEQLWKRWKHGPAAADGLAWRDLQNYIASSIGSDPPLVRFYTDTREEVFDVISYNKGGAILRYLNALIGDDAFDKSMQLYLTRNALKSAEAHDWRLAIEDVTGQDWNWFFNQWYYHAGHPELKVIYNYDDANQVLHVSVDQVQEDTTLTYQLPLKTLVIYGSEKNEVAWNLTDKKHIFSFPYKGGIRPAIVPDYNHVLPGEIKENKMPEQWLGQWLVCSDFVNKKMAIQAAGKQMQDSMLQSILDIALLDSIPAIRKYTIETIGKTYSDKKRRRWRTQILQMAKSDPDNQARAAAIEVLGDWKVKDAKDNLLMAVWDSSYVVAGNALEALAEIDKDTACIVARRVVVTKPRAELETAAWVIIGKSAADEDIELYRRFAPFVSGNKKISFALTLNNYLRNVPGNSSFTEAAAIYANLIHFETVKSHRSAIGIFLFQAAADQKGKLENEDPEVAKIATVRRAILKDRLKEVVDREEDVELNKIFTKLFMENF